MKKRNAVRTAMILPMVLVMTVGAALKAFAASTVNVTATGTYMQSEARRMLPLINDFRSDSPWYWNADNKTKTCPKDLKPLIYDYRLEKIAMQRAAELTLYFDHERPDGRDCFTAYSDFDYPYANKGENIAVDFVGTADRLFNDWKEEDEKYLYQGHRRNMLSDKFEYIGMAFFKVGSYYYCVQEFSNKPGGDSATAANDSVTSISLPISSSHVSGVSFSCDSSPVVMEIGDTRAVPEAALEFTTEEGYVLPTDLPVKYSSSDSVGLSVSGGKLTAKNAGSYKLTASTSYDGTTYSKQVSVTVNKRSLKAPSVTAALVSADKYVYDGAEKKPKAVVKYGC